MTVRKPLAKGDDGSRNCYPGACKYGDGPTNCPECYPNRTAALGKCPHMLEGVCDGCLYGDRYPEGHLCASGYIRPDRMADCLTCIPPPESTHTYHDHHCAGLACEVCCCRLHGPCSDCPKHGEVVRILAIATPEPVDYTIPACEREA